VVTRGALLVCVCSAAALMAAGQEPSPGPSSQIFGTRTTAVVVDVVVRDRKGSPVTDLRVDVIAYDVLAERASVRQFEVPAARR
jgi:hypothetical protein